MSYRRVNRLPLLRALIMLVVGVVCSPADAFASCGEYVLMTGSASHSQSQVGYRDMVMVGLSGDQQIVGAARDSRAPCPCRGPSCSNRPVNPPAVPHRFTISSTDHWGLMPESLEFQWAGHSKSLAIPASVHPTLSASHIFRPPRPAAAALKIRQS